MSHRHAPEDRPPLLQQPAQPRRPWRPPPRRQEPGIEATIEPALHLAAMQDGTVLTFTLDDGSTIRGRVEWYDRRCVCVRREDGVPVVIYKSAVRDTRTD